MPVLGRLKAPLQPSVNTETCRAQEAQLSEELPRVTESKCTAASVHNAFFERPRGSLMFSPYAKSRVTEDDSSEDLAPADRSKADREKKGP